MGQTDGEPVGVGQRLERARRALRRERRRTADEVQALRRLEGRVRDIDPETAAHTAGTAAGTTVVGRDADGLDAVRTAYEETVMSVPHYDEEYDDTYVESVAAEFSTDLAAALTDGTRFNAPCKRTLLSAIDAGRSARARLLELLSAEADSLAAAADTLTPLSAELADLEGRAVVTAPHGMLDAYGARLSVLERKCETVADDRQATLFEQRRTGGLPVDEPDLPQYVYQPCSFDYPVMASVADCTAAVDRIRAAVDDAMDGTDATRERVE